MVVVLPVVGGFVNTTVPVSFRKALAPGVGTKFVPVGLVWRLQGPEVAIGTGERLPSLLPIARPPGRLTSTWPLAFSFGTTSLTRSAVLLTGTQGRKQPKQGEVPSPGRVVIGTAVPPEGAT
jgi:hypothetical protein